MSARLERSTGNVFRDLGYSPAKAENLRIRAELMVEVARFIKRRKLTQAAAAKLMRVTQPRISDLVRGKINVFSIDSLVDMLTHAKVPVRIEVGRSRRSRQKTSKAA